MSVDTLIANKTAIPEMLRQAGYPWMANQTANDLAELCQMYGENLRECQREHYETLAILRDIVDAIEDEHDPAFTDPQYTDRELELIKRARIALRREVE